MSLFKAGMSVFILFTSQTLFAANPEGIEFLDLTYSGNGCPSGTVAYDISEDGEAFTLLYDEFIAEYDPSISDRRARSRNATKACRITFDIKVPSGWSYSIVNVDFMGYAQLDRNVIGRHAANVMYPGSRGAIRFDNLRLRGPFDDDYTRYDEVDVERWSSCSRISTVTIQAKVSVRAPRRGSSNAYGIMTVDSTEGEVTEHYRLKWRRCR